MTRHIRAHRISLSLLAPALVFSLVACTTDGGAPSSTVTTDGGAPASTVLPIVSGASGAQPVLTAPKGEAPTELMIEDVIVGTGAKVTGKSAILVHYVLMGWTSGQVLETSWSAEPFTTTLDQVIPGWQQGIPGMKVGGRRLLVIPPSLGYGEQPIGGVANETLVFVVDLIGFRNL